MSARNPLVVEEREEIDGSWSYRAHCLHCTWDAGWNDPHDFNGNEWAAQDHAEGQLADHAADWHPVAQLAAVA